MKDFIYILLLVGLSIVLPVVLSKILAWIGARNIVRRTGTRVN